MAEATSPSAVPAGPGRRGRRRKPLRAAGAGLLVAACLGCGSERQPPPNLILISLDTTRADSLSSYGARRANTPHLDRLAAESVVFNDCLAQSTATAPSHMSLLTGQYVHRHGLLSNGQGIDPRVTLASTLREAGWTTAAFTGHGSFRAELGLDHGFEVFDSWTGERRWPFTRSTPEVLPRAEAWLREEPRKPFFLLVHAYDPHCPYWPPQPWRDEYAGWYEGELDPQRLCGLAGYGPLFEQGLIEEDEKRYLRDLYEAEVAAADAALGGFLEGLRKSGALERSILVFTSDHGEVLGQHDWVGHTSLWEEEMQVPLMVRFPQGRWSRQLDDPAQLIDVMPTLLSALGVDLPGGVQGVDLMPRIRGESAPLSDDRMRLSGVGNLESVRFDLRWKIAFRREARGRLADKRIFDLDQDPGETTNLYSRRDGAERFHELLARYRSWRSKNGREDARYRGKAREIEGEPNEELLKALGYL